MTLQPVQCAVLHNLKCLGSLSSHTQHLWTTQDAGIKTREWVNE